MRKGNVSETSAEASPSVRPVEKRAHERWAEELGMLPALSDAGAFGAKLNPKFPAYAAGRGFRGWPEGFEVTREEFDRALEEAARQPIR